MNHKNDKGYTTALPEGGSMYTFPEGDDNLTYPTSSYAERTTLLEQSSLSFMQYSKDEEAALYQSPPGHEDGLASARNFGQDFPTTW